MEFKKEILQPTVNLSWDIKKSPKIQPLKKDLPFFLPITISIFMLSFLALVAVFLFNEKKENNDNYNIILAKRAIHYSPSPSTIKAQSEKLPSSQEEFYYQIGESIKKIYN